MSDYELPEGWRWARLGEVAVYINGRAFKPEDWEISGLPIIRIANLTSPDAPFNYHSHPVDDRYYVSNGDLLISWSASLDAFIWERGPAILNQHIFKVVENPDLINRRYLYYAVREVMDEIRSQTHGATMRHIRKGEFEATRIPLPPLDEQRRITAILDEQMAAVEQARAAAEAQLEAVQSLISVYLREVFESGDVYGSTTVLLDEICDMPAAKSVSSKGDIEVQAITTACLTETGFDFSGIKPTLMHAKDVEQAQISEGEILIARSNTPELVGRVSMFPGGLDDIVASDLTFRLVPHSGIVPGFLTAFLSYLYLDGYWQERAGGTSPSMKKITKTQLRDVEVPLPPMEQQQKIADCVADLMETTNDTVSILQEQLDTINALPASLLRHAFSGEL